jgi:hypothetical protein
VARSSPFRLGAGPRFELLMYVVRLLSFGINRFTVGTHHQIWFKYDSYKINIRVDGDHLPPGSHFTHDVQTKLKCNWSSLYVSKQPYESVAWKSGVTSYFLESYKSRNSQDTDAVVTEDNFWHLLHFVNSEDFMSSRSPTAHYIMWRIWCSLRNDFQNTRYIRWKHCYSTANNS